MKKAVLIGLFATLALGQVIGGTLVTGSYASGDVLLGFRKSGVSSDLVVDAGPIATLTNTAPNTRINITQFTTNQLYVVGLNSLSFSAFTWVDNSTMSQDSSILFVSQPRASINTQSTAPSRAPATAQFAVGGDMLSVQLGGNDAYTNPPPYNALSTPAAALEPDSATSTYYTTGRSYSDVMGSGANFSGDYGGSPELTTPANFITGSTVVRSDFYAIPPSSPAGFSGPVKFLGYFELNTNGLLAYVAYPTGIPTVPVIQSIIRSNTVSIVKFTTGNSGTYTLRGTNSAGFGTPKTNWPAVTSVAGTGSAATLRDTNSTSPRFYVITAQ